MVINTSKEQLQSLLQIVIGVVEKRNTVPILGNILFVLSPGRITATATDTEIEITTSDLLEHTYNQRFTVSAQKIFDIVKSLPDLSAIQMTLVEDLLTVESGNFNVKLHTLDAEEFPDFAPIEDANEFRIAENTLKKLIESVRFAMANQDARYFLNGMLWDYHNGHLRLVATDGHRMGLIDSPEPIEGQLSGRHIIPNKAIKEIARLLNDTNTEVAFKISERALEMQLGDIQFSSRLIEGNYPDYETVIPAHNPLEVIVDRQQLRSALQRALILADDRRAASFSIEDWKLTIESTSNDQDNAQEVVDINYQGEQIKTGFNLNYMLDVLNTIDSEVIHLFFKNSTSTCRIQGNPITGIYMVSPMRI